jgi:hypothetical protein
MSLPGLDWATDADACCLCREAPEDALATRPGVHIVREELVLDQRGAGGGTKILGTREYARIYKQRFAHPSFYPGASEQTRLTYHGFGLPAVAKEEVVRRSERRKFERRKEWSNMKSQFKNEKIFNLPKNCTH